jgi:release factor glutamine methyltransferase
MLYPFISFSTLFESLYTELEQAACTDTPRLDLRLLTIKAWDEAIAKTERIIDATVVGGIDNISRWHRMNSYLCNIDAPSLADFINNQETSINQSNQNDHKLFLDNFIQNLQVMVARRKKHEPIAYIIGYKDFWQYRFRVNCDVLIPRPDSEILVEVILRYFAETDSIKEKRNIRILDLGIGSGCLLLSIIADLRAQGWSVSGTGIDVSASALDIAKANARALNLEPSCIKFMLSDWFYALDADKQFDVIISNPPYIPIEEWENKIDKGVKDFEPFIALTDGGYDGLSHYRTIVKEAHKYLRKNGMLALECGYNQAGLVRGLLEMEQIQMLAQPYKGYIISKLESEGVSEDVRVSANVALEKNNAYTEIATHKDLAGFERVVSACAA